VIGHGSLLKQNISQIRNHHGFAARCDSAVSVQERNVQKRAALCMLANYYKLNSNRQSASIRNSAIFIEKETVANLIGQLNQGRRESEDWWQKN
jgi:hypothetical protein